MQKYMIMILSVVFIASMCAGCSNNSKNESDAAYEETTIQKNQNSKNTDNDLLVKEEEIREGGNVLISTEYIPVAL